MVDARALHGIAKALRALQIRAVRAGSSDAEAYLMTTAHLIRDMAIAAEKGERPPARTVQEMMRRLKNGQS